MAIAHSLPVAAGLAIVLFSGTASAQAFQCTIPGRPIPVTPVTRDGEIRRTAISGYSLSLSWAPEYCRGKESLAADAFECSGTHGRFGLILHGLWPESRGANWPQWCPNPRKPSAELLRQNLCRTPSAQLAAHEWAKHGACMVERPETYFRVSGILWDALRIPDFDVLSRRDGLTAGRIRENFVAANPLYPPASVGVEINERGWFTGFKLCLDRKFLPTRCDPVRFGASDKAAAKIWRGL